MPPLEVRRNLEEKIYRANRIIDYVGDYFNVNVRNKSRKREYTMPKQIAIYLIDRYILISLSEIGKLFPTARGYMDHSNVHFCKYKIIDIMPFDKEIKNHVNNLKEDAKELARLDNNEFLIYKEKQNILNLLEGLDIEEIIKIRKKIAKLVQ